jgi:hypothetical protein
MPMSTSAATPEIVWLTQPGNASLEEFGAEGEATTGGPSAALTRPSAPARLEGAGSRRAAASMPTVERGRSLVAAVVLGLLALGQAPFVVLWAMNSGAAAPSAAGTFFVETLPEGIEVQVDGNVVGTTPLQVIVPPGRRTVRLHHDGRERFVTMQVAPGETVRQRFEFLPAPSPVVAAASPVAAPARVASPKPLPPGALSGWVRVQASASFRIFEAGRLLGTTDVDRLMLPVGEHVLELRSEELRFSDQQTVRIGAGETTTVQVRLPSAPLSINAKPWAEAWVNGERVGDTPIGNLIRPIGRHEVVLRHPELGERREIVLVTVDQPARVSVDFGRGR